MRLTRRQVLQAGAAAAFLGACAPPPPGGGPLLSTTQPTTPPTTAPRRIRPLTIVVVIADDMRFDFRSILRHLDGSWIDCVNAAIETPMCGPSRAALFKGMYSSRTGVDGNGTTDRMDDRDTIATRIHAAGYRTLLSGKYLNYFPWSLDGSYVPPGWDVWNAAGSAAFQPKGLHPTDYIFGFAAAQIRATPATTPMFMWVAPTAPHLPANPPDRYANAFPALPPIPPSFNEADLSDKPSVHQAPLLSSTEIATINADRLEIGRSLLGVDDGLATLLAALSDTGRLDTTVLFFLSDNGYLLGEHRLVKKGEAYEEPSRIPFMVRWPGVAGRSEPGVISSVDLSAAVCALAGTAPPGTDGVDLAPLLTGGTAVRDVAYIEPPGGGYDALRSAAHKYVEYGNGERELYELATDPYELTNVAADPAFAATVATLSKRLQTFKPA
jgi:arylsulfatase A-like enzyme